MATSKKTASKTTAVATVKAPKTAVGATSDWREEMAKYAAKTVKMEESTQTGNRISTKGGRLTYHDTPLKNNEMNVIILAALLENVYYPGDFDPENPASPTCFAFSEDGEDMAPHEKSHDPQCETCEKCEQNQWGSSDRGKGKKCKNTRRLAVIPMEDLSLDAINSAEIATLGLPVTSVRGYAAYAKDLALAAGRPPFAWRTRIWCEPDAKTQYRVCFQVIDKTPIADKFMDAIIRRVKEAEKVLDQPYVYVEPPEPKAKPRAAKGKSKY